MVFDSGGSYVYHKKERTLMKVIQERGVFNIDAYFNVDQDEAAKMHEGFQRQGSP